MSVLLITGVFLVTFAAVAVAVVAGRKLLQNRETAAEPLDSQDDNEFDWLTPVKAPLILKQEDLSTISFLNRLLARVDGVEIMKQRITEAGLLWSVGRLITMMLLAGAASFVILWKMSWVSSWVMLAVAGGAALAPYWIVLRRRRKRLGRIEDQFPDAMDSLARSLRAGNALSGAMELLARETPQPLGRELRRIVEERALGMNWDVALDHLARRVPVVEVSIFVAAVGLQSRTGGKLHEVLAKLADTMRESASLKGEVRSITAHGKLTGTLLTILPLVIVLMMSYVNPHHILLLWMHPAGNKMVWAAAGCLVAAHFVIRKLVDIKV